MPKFSGQGPLKIAPRLASGWPGVFRNVGDLDPAAGLDFTPKLDIFDIKETQSGQRSTVDRLIQGKDGTLKFKLRDWIAANLAMQVLGESTVVEAGTVTAEPLPNPVAAGDMVSLRHPKVSSVVLTDSAGSPATLVAGTNYRLDDADFGNLTILDVADKTQPIKAAYSYAERIQVPVLIGQLQEVCVRAEIVNTANGMKKVLAEFYRVSFDIGKVLKLIQEKGVADGEIEGMVLIDTTKPNDPVLGQFGRIIDMDMAA
ncbi:phage tail tube protein [Methylomagnum sp.]